MSGDSVEKRASLEKSDVEEKAADGEQGLTLVDDAKAPEAPVISPQSTMKKLEGTGANTEIEGRWLTGKKLALVHMAMLLASVEPTICNAERADIDSYWDFQVLAHRA